MANVVLVVDMVRGFCEEGRPLFVRETARIVEPIRRLLAGERARGSAVIFLCDNHDPDDAEFQMFAPHCIRGSDETQVIPELREFATEVIPKARFSCFFGTNLDQRLRELKPDKIIMAGVCTDICVMHTVADARDRDHQVEVPADCVATFDPEAHRFALRHMEKVLGARVVEPSEAPGKVAP